MMKGDLMLSLSRDMAKRIDDYLIGTIGIPRDILIEHAALAVTKSCVSYLEKQKMNGQSCTVHVFAGKGMNGLDAFACARNLYAMGYKVRLWDVFPGKREKIEWQICSCENLGMPVQPAKDYRPEENSLIVDGIFGTAFTIGRSFSASLKNLFQKINTGHDDTGSHLIAIDLPSGVETDTGEASLYTILADETVTFICPKIGIMTYPGRKYAGQIHIDGIGFPQQLIEKMVEDLSIQSDKPNSLPHIVDFAAAKQWLPQRPVEGHKGNFGRVGLIGGSEGMAGSICLSAMAAMRSGVGLTYMRVPKRIEADCIATVPEALISTDYKTVLEGMDAVLIGPGMDDTQQSIKMLWTAVETVPRLVLDAGALTILSKYQQEALLHLKNRKDRNLPWLILTPHPGEFKRLMPDLVSTNRIMAAKTAAKRWERLSS